MHNRNLDYHRLPQPGKLGICITKPCNTGDDLAMAYSPGVADPCLEIHKDPFAVYDYTAKGNMVAVISDGTAVLGLGDLGAAPAIPVMEGKAVLFKRFAGIDAVPLCLNVGRLPDGRQDVQTLIETISRLEPCFGGINLEDIAAPACFELERELKKRLDIPVFHDDQHGTAIICTAGVLNSLELVGKRIQDISLVINGAGAAGISCAEMCIRAGVDPSRVIMCDSRGVIYKGREPDPGIYKQRFAVDSKARSLQDALAGADVFLGLSKGGCVSPEMIASMAKDPVVFAMANPVPEIDPALALGAGAAIVGTGRSDFPNQVNNVLGFPGLFRGALDCRSRDICEEMKMAAALALAGLTREAAGPEVLAALEQSCPQEAAAGIFEGQTPLKPEYVIPKPFDPRVVPRVARAVAEAACKNGSAAISIEDFDAYEASLARRLKGI